MPGHGMFDCFTKPRSLTFDSSGALLVLDSGVGVKRLSFTDNGGTCLVPNDPVLVVDATSLNHGLSLSNDGKTIYASNAGSVFAWSYDPSSGTVSGTNTTVVSGMANNDQVTRTLLVSHQEPDMLVVSRGADDSSDARILSSGLGQIKAFNLSDTSSQPYNFDTTGWLLGWGLYNAVGLDEHPITGGIFSMDNGANDVTRDGVDIHQSNPGDEMNFHGFLNGTTAISPSQKQGTNYGYPDCYAVWNTSIPDAPAGLKVGEQFSLVDNSSLNDTTCQADYVAPWLTFAPHQAPLDITFAQDGTVAYISFHGSTDKTNPVGYLIGQVAFNADTGMPTEASDSITAIIDIIRNTDDSGCPSSCLRPVGLAIDGQGRLFFSSDSTGEIYVLVKSSTGTSTSSSTGPGTMVMPTTTKKSTAGMFGASRMGAVVAIIAALGLVL
ncbi:L-sorbosone dehydrogenase [Cytospora mali]|uniref:L-sorbosone dehydrogenase n=1 Tax=Cytospora mali TaxID=578113 RepID=A0A194V045_CYTMA|nr:L-sorbosone dehydrogenase [Valsa mali var. pyri (nom. inval.)]